MTKDQEILYSKIADERNITQVYTSDVRKELDKFFESNVCIPKGDNRHQYAEALHEWIEGGNIEYCDPFRSSKWIDFSLIDRYEFRIKPSEPIYEWQWVLIKDGKVVRFDDTDWYTEDDVKGKGNWIKIEETKRERNQ